MTDRQEFERIVTLYKLELYKYCYRNVNYDQSLADETINDVLKVLADKWDTLDVSVSIRAYLYRVADNCIKYNITKNYRYYQRNASLEEMLENRKFDHAEHYDQYFAEKELDEEEYIERIKESLPEEYRQIFYQRYIEKKTIKEIASLTGIPYSTLRLRINTIEELVRKEISNIFENFL